MSKSSKVTGLEVQGRGPRLWIAKFEPQGPGSICSLWPEHLKTLKFKDLGRNRVILKTPPVLRTSWFRASCLG